MELRTEILVVQTKAMYGSHLTGLSCGTNKKNKRPKISRATKGTKEGKTENTPTKLLEDKGKLGILGD